jgi:hypothetical protein
MDPLHVSMTGVRMGERFLQIGCSDRALLSGLAAKVGLSGSASVAALAPNDAKNAEAVGRKIGALIEVRDIDQGRSWPYDTAQFDMIVVDDTQDSFGDAYSDTGGVILKNALRSLRDGGRIELVARSRTDARFDAIAELTRAGFKPVRLLAERDGFRFIEGLRPATGAS